MKKNQIWAICSLMVVGALATHGKGGGAGAKKLFASAMVAKNIKNNNDDDSGDSSGGSSGSGGTPPTPSSQNQPQGSSGPAPTAAPGQPHGPAPAASPPPLSKMEKVFQHISSPTYPYRCNAWANNYFKPCCWKISF